MERVGLLSPEGEQSDQYEAIDLSLQVERAANPDSGANGDEFYRLPHRQLCSIKRAQVIIITITVFFGILTLGYFLHHSPPGASDQISWKEKIRDVPDFSQCLEGYAKNPPLVVMSMDGLAARFISQTENIALLAANGLKAEHMRPVFPSNTFPNHYAMVTGLYPESHGIIDNTFWNEFRNETFKVWTETKFDPKWWKGRPIWQVAQEQGLRVFTKYWPGSEVLINGVRPTLYVNFSKGETVESRAEFIVNSLLLPAEKRPHMILNYYHEPDEAVHDHGLQSPVFTEALRSADRLVALLMDGLHRNNLTDCVNVIVLSDHGMSKCTGSSHPSEKLKSAIGDKWNGSVFERGPIVQNRLHPDAVNFSISASADALRCQSPDSPYQIYSSEGEASPIRLHYRNNPRIAPVILLANVSTSMYEPGVNETCATFRAVHGWDTIHSDVQATFVAFGPSFKTKTIVEPFNNIELFGLFADLLGIAPGEYNGTYGSLKHLLRDTKEQLDAIVAELPSVFPPLSNNGHPQQLRQSNDETQSCESFDVSFGRGDEYVAGTGIPRALDGDMVVLNNRNHIVGFSRKFRYPMFVSFRDRHILRDMANFINFDHSCYLKDPRVEVTRMFTCDRDEESAVVQTSLFPSYFRTETGVKRAGVLSSAVIPLFRTFHEGYWKRFWERVSYWAANSTELDVTVGPVFDQEFPFGIADTMEKFWNADRLPIPSHLFIILTRKKPNPRCSEASCVFDVASFILPNLKTDSIPCQHDQFWLLTRSATVVDIERVTGLQFFTALPKTEAARLRTRLLDKLWDMEKMI